MCGISICRESYAHAFIVRGYREWITGCDYREWIHLNPAGFIESNTWLSGMDHGV